MITLYLLIWFLVPEANAYIDRKGRKPIYIQTFIFRGIAAFFHWCIFIRTPDQWPLLVWLIVFQLTAFWIWFEIRLNLYRGKPILYYDTTENDSGWIDRFFAKLGLKWHLAAKVTALVTMIISIVRIYQLT